jgi:hypothetical protein
MATITDLQLTDSGANSLSTINENFSNLNAESHSPVTVTDSTEIDFTLTGQEITASLKSGSINETKLDTSVNASLDLADSALQNIVEDTTPQLGGQLDVNGQALGDGTLELLKFEETASAVNEITIKNAATGNAPELKATGDDSNIDLNLVPKGTGGVKVGGVEIPSISSTSTLTNKRITQRVSATTSVASITPDISSYDVYELTAQNDNFTLNLPSVDEVGQTIVVRILTSSAKTLTIDAGYKAENTLPTALASGKRYEFIINQFNTGGSKEYWITGIEF